MPWHLLTFQLDKTIFYFRATVFRDVGSISNLGGARHFKGTFSFFAKSWGGTCPQCPPGSYVSDGISEQLSNRSRCSRKKPGGRNRSQESAVSHSKFDKRFFSSCKNTVFPWPNDIYIFAPFPSLSVGNSPVSLRSANPLRKTHRFYTMLFC